MVQRIVRWDVASHFTGIAPSWLLKACCCFLGVVFAVVLRSVANRFAPGVAPYAFVYPATLLTTLLGGWEAGIGTLVILVFLTWRFVVPQAGQAGVQMHYQAAAMLIAALTGALMIAVAEGFRAAARNVVRERNAKLAQRDLLFRELQHRVGNDFAIVSGLLDLQRQRSDNPETRNALDSAMGRIGSIARIHRQIYALPDSSSVDLRQYLQELCANLSDAVLPPTGVSLQCECDPVMMPRERALSLGLAANELITNAIKHAFPGGKEGSIHLRFARGAAGWQLSIRDDGIGTAAGSRKSGLGTGLISQFVRQAEGTLRVENKDGTLAVIDLPFSAAFSFDSHAAPGAGA
jgi:two-component sensor histidine kinase